MVCSHGCIDTNKYVNMHAHKLVHTFQISNQPKNWSIYYFNTGTSCLSTWCYGRVSITFRVWLKGHGHYFLQSQPRPLSHVPKMSWTGCILNAFEHYIIYLSCLYCSHFFLKSILILIINVLNVNFAKLLCFDCNSLQHSYSTMWLY